MAARIIDAFEYTSRTCDIVFSAIYALPEVPRQLLRDRENLIELYNNQQLLLRHRFSKKNSARTAAVAASGSKQKQPATAFIADATGAPGPQILQRRYLPDRHRKSNQRVTAYSVPSCRQGDAPHRAAPVLKGCGFPGVVTVFFGNA